jgi:hypothetical protein
MAMGQKDLTKIAIAVVLLIVGGVLIVKYGGGQDRRGGPAPDSLYYLDLQSGELVHGPTDGLSPIDLPSGNQGVRAFVYTCGDCTESELLVGYVQKYNDKAAEATRQLEGLEEDKRQMLYQVIQAGTFVAPEPEAGAQPQWVSLSDPRGMKVTQKFQSLCKGKLARICTPAKAK